MMYPLTVLCYYVFVKCVFINFFQKGCGLFLHTLRIAPKIVFALVLGHILKIIIRIRIFLYELY